MTGIIVEVKNLSKRYKTEKSLQSLILRPFKPSGFVQAIEDISLELHEGTILGLIGPNGAGKTTLLRILADLISPDNGIVKICGNDLTGSKGQLRKHIGYISSDERSFFWRLTGRENLLFFAGLYGLEKSHAHKKIDAMLDAMNLTEKSLTLFRDYSAGTRKKFSIIRGLIHKPKLLLMDEATNNLDTESMTIIKKLVRQYISNNPGCAAIWSTHRYEELDEICDDVISIRNGQINNSH